MQAKELLHAKLAAEQRALQEREVALQAQVAVAQLQLELLSEAREQQQQQQQQQQQLRLHAVNSASDINSFVNASSPEQQQQYSSSDQNSNALDGNLAEDSQVPLLAPELQPADPWAAFKEAAAAAANVGDDGPAELELPLWMLPRSMAVKVHEATAGPGISSSTSGRGRRLSESDSCSCSDNDSVNGLPAADEGDAMPLADAAQTATAGVSSLRASSALSVPFSLRGGGPVPPSMSTLSLGSHAQSTLDQLQQRLQGKQQHRDDQVKGSPDVLGLQPAAEDAEEEEEVAVKDTAIMDDELLNAFKDLKLHHDYAHQQPYQCGELAAGIDDVVARMKTCYCKMVRELQREMNQLQLCVEQLQEMEAEQAAEAAETSAADGSRVGRRVSFAAGTSSSKQQQLEQQQQLLSRHFRRLTYLYRAAISMPRSAARAGPGYFWRFFAPLNHPSQRTCPRTIWQPGMVGTSAVAATAAGGGAGVAVGGGGGGVEREAAAAAAAGAGQQRVGPATSTVPAGAEGRGGPDQQHQWQQQQQEGEAPQEDMLQRLLAGMGPPKGEDGSDPELGSENGEVAMEWFYDFEPMVPEVQCSMWEGDPLQEYDELLKDMQESIAHGEWHLLQQPRPMEGVVEQRNQQQQQQQGAGDGYYQQQQAGEDLQQQQQQQLRAGEAASSAAVDAVHGGIGEGGGAPAAAAITAGGLGGVMEKGLGPAMRVDWEAGFFRDGVVPDEPPEELYEVALQLLCITPKQSEMLLEVRICAQGLGLVRVMA